MKKSFLSKLLSLGIMSICILPLSVAHFSACDLETIRTSLRCHYGVMAEMFEENYEAWRKSVVVDLESTDDSYCFVSLLGFINNHEEESGVKHKLLHFLISNRKKSELNVDRIYANYLCSDYIVNLMKPQGALSDEEFGEYYQDKSWRSDFIMPESEKPVERNIKFKYNRQKGFDKKYGIARYAGRGRFDSVTY